MSAVSRPKLEAMVAAELATPVDPAVAAVAEAARAAHGEAVCAVLFYGSCLRDGYHEGLMVDLYLLVDGYAAVHGPGLMRRLLVEAGSGQNTRWSACLSSSGWSARGT
jgi:hypothetical protein